MSLMSDGSAFQARGPAMEKALSDRWSRVRNIAVVKNLGLCLFSEVGDGQSKGYLYQVNYVSQAASMAMFRQY